MSATVATASEVAQARTFLKYLGKNWRDEYLVLAVISFFRGAKIKDGLKAAKHLKAGKEASTYPMVIRTLLVGGIAGAAQFLYAIAVAGWYGNHFGIHGLGEEGDVNQLVTIFERFKSYVTPEQQKAINDAKAANKRELARRRALRPPVNPRAIEPPVITRNWTSGFTVVKQYEQSHRPLDGDSSGLLDLST